MDAVPRISRAQSLDVLSMPGQHRRLPRRRRGRPHLPRFFPMLMTAAGKIPPAQVLVLGAGVAGLQAIAHRRPPRRDRHRLRRRAPRSTSRSTRSARSSSRSRASETPRAQGGYAHEMTRRGAGRAQREALTRPDAQVRHDHHHGPDPGPARAEARLHGETVDGDEARRGDRRHGRRGTAATASSRKPGEDDHHRQRRRSSAPLNLAEPDGRARVAALRHEPPVAARS